MWSLKSIHQLGTGPCDKPFERLTVLGVCSRMIFHSACMRDVEMVLHCVSSLVGKPPCMVQSLGIKDFAVADSVSQGYPTLEVGTCVAPTA